MSVSDTKPEKITPAHMPIRLAAHKRGGVDNHGEQKERVRMNNVWTTTTTTTLLCVCVRAVEKKGWQTKEAGMARIGGKAKTINVCNAHNN